LLNRNLDFSIFQIKASLFERMIDIEYLINQKIHKRELSDAGYFVATVAKRWF